MEHNALSGLLLYNETLNENKMISTYSSQRAEALISSGPVPTWTNAHTYSVRKKFLSYHLYLQHLLQHQQLYR